MSNILKSATIGLALLTEVACTSLPQGDHSPEQEAQPPESHLMTDKPSQRALDLDLNADPFIVEYGQHDVISEEQLHVLVDEVRDNTIFQLVQNTSYTQEQLENELSSFTEDVISKIIENSTELEGDLVDFAEAEDFLNAIVNTVEEQYNVTYPENERDISSLYEAAFPDNTTAHFDLPDKSHLPDLSNDPHAREVIERFAEDGKEIKLATPNEYSAVLEYVVEINDLSNELNGTDHTPPPVFVGDDNSIAIAGYFHGEEEDFILVNHTDAVLAPSNLKGIIAHELGHREQLLNGVAINEPGILLDSSWKEDCNIIEEFAVNAEWRSKLTEIDNVPIEQSLNALGATANEIKNNLADHMLIGEECAQGVADKHQQASDISQKNEFEADEFAVKVGAGENLKDFFEFQAEFRNQHTPFNEDELHSHPSFGDRADRLEQSLEKNNPFDAIDEHGHDIKLDEELTPTAPRHSPSNEGIKSNESRLTNDR